MSTTHAAFDALYGIRTDGQIHRGALNLDCMPQADLAIAAEHPALHVDVRDYAIVRYAACTLRLAGDIEKASRLESKLERLYSALPRALRW